MKFIYFHPSRTFLIKSKELPIVTKLVQYDRNHSWNVKRILLLIKMIDIETLIIYVSDFIGSKDNKLNHLGMGVP